MSARSNCFIMLFKSTIFLLIFFLVHYESLQIKEITFISVFCVLSTFFEFVFIFVTISSIWLS